MDITTLIILIIIGFVAGIVSGLVGLGGGIIIVPALVFMLGFSQAQAQGTSLAILLLPVGILAVINYMKNGYVNIKYAAVIAVIFVIGAYFGSKIAISIPQAALKKIFGCVMLAVAVKMIFGK